MSQLYRNAICLPCTGSENRPLVVRGAQGGIFDRNRKPIKASFLFRYYRQHSKIVHGRWDPTTGHETIENQMVLPGTVADTKARLEGRHIFAGYLFPHFGHFLLESLSRLWFIRQHPDLPLVWLGVHNQSDFTAMQRQVFDLIGLKNPMRLITEQTAVEDLVVPEAGYIINSYFSDEQADALKLGLEKTPIPGKKVWLSRSKLTTAIVHNEPILENILAENGWIIYHPEEHTIRDQIEMLSDAELIAGIEGSAFHSLILLPDFKGRIVIFARGAKFNMDYSTIAHKLGHDMLLAVPPRVRWDTSPREWEASWLWTDIDFLADTLKAQRPAVPATPLPKALREVTRSLAEFFKRQNINEFWAETNAVAPESGIANSVVISDKLAFDLAPVRAAGTRYFDMTSDQFFTIQPATARCDLFCFRHQTDYDVLLRAFNSSLNFARPETLWIIEGRDPEKTSANEKLLATIQNTFPAIRLARVLGSNVAVAWKQGRLGFKPDATAQDMTSPDFMADIPVMAVNDIAKAILDSRTLGK